MTFKAICYTEKHFSSLLAHPIWRHSPFDKYIKVPFYPALKNTISNPVPKKGLAEADLRAGIAPLKYHICETTDQQLHMNSTPSTKDLCEDEENGSDTCDYTWICLFRLTGSGTICM